MEIFVVLMTVALSGVTWGLVRLCARLRSGM